MLIELSSDMRQKLESVESRISYEVEKRVAEKGLQLLAQVGKEEIATQRIQILTMERDDAFLARDCALEDNAAILKAAREEAFVQSEKANVDRNEITALLEEAIKVKENAVMSRVDAIRERDDAIRERDSLPTPGSIIQDIDPSLALELAYLIEPVITLPKNPDLLTLRESLTIMVRHCLDQSSRISTLLDAQNSEREQFLKRQEADKAEMEVSQAEWKGQFQAYKINLSEKLKNECTIAYQSALDAMKAQYTIKTQSLLQTPVSV